jgi:hypothetical protein
MKTKLNIDGKYYEGELTEVQDEEITKEKKWRWVPKVGEKYWFSGDFGDIMYANWANVCIDKTRLSLGNVFKTEADCQAHLDYLKAVEILKADAEYWEADWKDRTQEKYYAWYDFYDKEFYTDYMFRIIGQNVYFPTRELLKSSIKNHRKEWLIVLGVKE